MFAATAVRFLYDVACEMAEYAAPRAPSVAPITSAHSPSLNASCSTITTAMLYWFDVPDAACCCRLYRITSTNDAFCTSISSKENHLRKTPPAERSGVVRLAPRMGGMAREQAAVGREAAAARTERTPRK